MVQSSFYFRYVSVAVISTLLLFEVLPAIVRTKSQSVTVTKVQLSSAIVCQADQSRGASKEIIVRTLN